MTECVESTYGGGASDRGGGCEGALWTVMMMMMIGDVELQFGDGRDRAEGKEDMEEIFGGWQL